MIGLVLCLFAFAAAFTQTRRSLGHGLAAVLAVGYGYGILRANFPSAFSHFIFDAAAFGLYMALFLSRLSAAGRGRMRAILPWFTGLAVWSFLMFLVPNQDYLVQLVGLRAAAYFLPFLLVGSLLKSQDFDVLARAVAILNIGAVAVAVLEYLFGLPTFFPPGPTTITIYGASDVAGGQHRLPATFASAHHFGGTMVATLPLLVFRLLRADVRRTERRLLITSVLATLVGVFLCGARTPAAHLVAIGGLFLAFARIPPRYKRGLVLVAIVAAVFVLRHPRMQRALTLSNPEYVTGRVEHALEVGIVDVLVDYPLGSGMGSAWGTSIPHFLADRVTLRLGAENEMVRLTLELGLPGLALWLALTLWVLVRRLPSEANARYEAESQLLLRLYVVAMWATAFIGAGLLLSIPSTVILLAYMGHLGRAPAPAPWPPFLPPTPPPLRVPPESAVGTDPTTGAV